MANDSVYKYGGDTSNEQPAPGATKGFGGKTPDQLGSDLSNEQTANGKTFKGFKPNDSGVDFDRGGDKSGNENPKGWKQ